MNTLEEILFVTTDFNINQHRDLQGKNCLTPNECLRAMKMVKEQCDTDNTDIVFRLTKENQELKNQIDILHDKKRKFQVQCYK